jgi:hypothetical protein
LEIIKTSIEKKEAFKYTIKYHLNAPLNAELQRSFKFHESNLE